VNGNVRNIKGEPFVQVPMQTVKDSVLSNSQLGFLTRLLSKPETWEYKPSQIADQFSMSKRTVNYLFDVLAGKGYIVRHDTRMQDDKGRWSRRVEYRVYASLKLRLEDNERTERKILRSARFPISTEDRKHALGA
jgi:DNA-binding MarR family transcriptional regulator